MKKKTRKPNVKLLNCSASSLLLYKLTGMSKKNKDIGLNQDAFMFEEYNT